MAITYTQRTLAYLRDEGFRAPWIVERWVGHSGRYGHRQDLWGLFDIVALRGGDTYGIQSTGPSGHASHRRAMIENPMLAEVKNAGWIPVLVSWRKLVIKRGGKARRWVPRWEEF